jgi:hypothetical protein
MMDTPRTDDLQKFVPIGDVWLNHSKALERENAELRAALLKVIEYDDTCRHSENADRCLTFAGNVARAVLAKYKGA